jgi:poly(3-hydroxyalkanoate) synthetase
MGTEQPINKTNSDNTYIRTRLESHDKTQFSEKGHIQKLISLTKTKANKSCYKLQQEITIWLYYFFLNKFVCSF